MLHLDLYKTPFINSSIIKLNDIEYNGSTFLLKNLINKILKKEIKLRYHELLILEEIKTHKLYCLYFIDGRGERSNFLNFVLSENIDFLKNENDKNIDGTISFY